MEIKIIHFWDWAVWKYGILSAEDITYKMLKEFAEL